METNGKLVRYVCDGEMLDEDIDIVFTCRDIFEDWVPKSVIFKYLYKTALSCLKDNITLGGNNIRRCVKRTHHG